MKLASFLIVLCLLFANTARAQQPARVDSLQMLVGKWVGEGTSEVGAGTGYFTFETGLKGRVLIRKNLAQYPATKDRASVTHEDLLVVHADTASGPLRGFYTDSEGNTINYVISVSGNTVVFASDPRDNGPRYRLTYVLTAPDRISLTFEIASPDKPDAYRTIVTGRVRRVTP